MENTPELAIFAMARTWPLTHPGALPYRPTVSYQVEVEGQRVIRIREAADGSINVFHPDPEAMAASKKATIEEIGCFLSSITANEFMMSPWRPWADEIKVNQVDCRRREHGDWGIYTIPSVPHIGIIHGTTLEFRSSYLHIPK